MTSTINEQPRTPSRSLNFVVAALGVGALASILDSTIVNVAVDQLAVAFGSDVGSTQWVITAFLLAMAAVVPLSGWLIDRLGGRTPGWPRWRPSSSDPSSAASPGTSSRSSHSVQCRARGPD